MLDFQYKDITLRSFHFVTEISSSSSSSRLSRHNFRLNRRVGCEAPLVITASFPFIIQRSTCTTILEILPLKHSMQTVSRNCLIKRRFNLKQVQHDFGFAFPDQEEGEAGRTFTFVQHRATRDRLAGVMARSTGSPNFLGKRSSRFPLAN